MVEPRDVPPHWEGLYENEELRPNQEPGWCRKAQESGMVQGENSTRALHGSMPLAGLA